MSKSFNVNIVEFTVAPQVNPKDHSTPYHEWFVELDSTDIDVARLEQCLDASMQQQNIYYQDLIEGRILRPAVVRLLRQGAFRDFMQSQGKLGGQNKVPRLSNDRTLADALHQYRR